MDKAHRDYLRHRQETRRAVVKTIEYDRESLQVRTYLLAIIFALAALLATIPYGPLAKAAELGSAQNDPVPLSDIIVADVDNDVSTVDATEPTGDVDPTNVTGVVGEPPMAGPSDLNLPAVMLGTGPVIPDDLYNGAPASKLYLPQLNR